MFKSLIKFFTPLFLTEEEKEPCPKCNGRMRHQLHQDSGCSAESKFKCDVCQHDEFRGGTGSEIWFECLYYDRKKFKFIRKF